MSVALKYIKQNREYQKLLDRQFHGKIVAVDRYVNGKAIIRHYCLSCGQSFYARPGYLINLRDNMHLCDKLGEKPVSQKALIGKSSKGISDEVKQEILALYDKGLSQYQIANQLEISRDTCRYWLKKLRA